MPKKKRPLTKLSKQFTRLISNEKYVPYFLFLISVLIAMYLFFLFQSTDKEIFFCGDSSENGFCSLTKPYYCANGSLVEKASICGCPENLIREGNNCFSEYHKDPKEVTLRYFLDGKESEINFTVYKGMVDYLSEIPRSIEHENGKGPSRADFKYRKINEEVQRNFLVPLVMSIKNITADEEDQVKIAVSIVQSIEWGYSNKTFRFAGENLVYSRYPYEILYDFMGICGEKSELLSFLLKELGFEVVLFYNQKENHESVGVKCPLEYSWNNSGYCFIETSGPAIISDNSMSYVGGIRITSKPLIINISEGMALGDDLEEYEDARRISEIRENALDNGKVGLLDKIDFYRLNEKYNLAKEYNLA